MLIDDNAFRSIRSALSGLRRSAGAGEARAGPRSRLKNAGCGTGAIAADTVREEPDISAGGFLEH